MNDSGAKRISRLTAIITQLQAKRLVTAPELAAQHGVSVRTIYRDMRALEDAGIPIYVEEGKGYGLMAHYRLPPVMFTENEANSLIAAEQLVLNNRDASLVHDYSTAIAKIKAVLSGSNKEKANLLAERTQFSRIRRIERTSDNLSVLQFALTNFYLVQIEYTNEGGRTTDRTVEPFALLSTQKSWLLVAWCRLRKDFRYFRLDRIGKLAVLSEKFAPHEMTLQEYFDRYYESRSTPLT
ncbi:MAG: YafY family transcriptional regulator [Caldilineaceae bacterium]|nr:YafY family transcriptional regulator [Caldilineaceae bacterium]